MSAGFKVSKTPKQAKKVKTHIVPRPQRNPFC